MIDRYGSERRRHKRFPILRDLAEPIEVTVEEEKPRTLPAVMTNLSAGGLDLVIMGTFNSAGLLMLTFNIPGIEGITVTGKKVWSRVKGETTLVGIEFAHIAKKHLQHINAMAKAYWDCEDRIDRGEFEICFRECPYWALCTKTVKLKL